MIAKKEEEARAAEVEAERIAAEKEAARIKELELEQER